MEMDLAYLASKLGEAIVGVTSHKLRNPGYGVDSQAPQYLRTKIDQARREAMKKHGKESMKPVGRAHQGYSRRAVFSETQLGAILDELASLAQQDGLPAQAMQRIGINEQSLEIVRGVVNSSPEVSASAENPQ